jgi:hypothetical protein
LVCALAVLSWQALTIHFNFQDNWTALFVTGEHFTVPPSLAAEHVWQAPKSDGWDGQFYHFIAHDPFLTGGMVRYTEAARLRYRRILIPAAAFLLATGQAGAIDWAYRLVILLFFVLGTCWTARLAKQYGRNPAWGLLFFFLPAAVASASRMAVDVGLCALVAAFVLYSGERRDSRKLYAVLVLAGLVRDTGLLLTAAYCLWVLAGKEQPLRKRVARAAVFGSAALPTLAWYLYVYSRTPPYPGGASLSIPLSGLIDRFIHLIPYPFAPWFNLIIRSLDRLALMGILLAFVLATTRHITERLKRPSGYAAILFVLLGLLLWHPGDWLDAIDYGRILSPLLFLLALEALETGSWLALAPLGMELPRFGLQMGSQAWGIIKGIAGMQ